MSSLIRTNLSSNQNDRKGLFPITPKATNKCFHITISRHINNNQYMLDVVKQLEFG